MLSKKFMRQCNQMIGPCGEGIGPFTTTLRVDAAMEDAKRPAVSKVHETRLEHLQRHSLINGIRPARVLVHPMP